MAITIIGEFSGSGNPGDTQTFTPDVPLAAGDIYLIAYAMIDPLGTKPLVGGLSITPSSAVSTIYGWTYWDCNLRLQARSVHPVQAGATSFTVTINQWESIFAIWLLRGADMASVTGANGDAGYTQNPWPYEFCHDDAELYEFGVNAFPIAVSSAAGSFGIYAVGNHAGLCGSPAGSLDVTGDYTAVIDENVTFKTNIQIGLLGTDGFVTSADVTASVPGEVYAAYAYGGAIIIAPGAAPDVDVPPATRPDLVVHRNIFAGSTTAAVDLTGAINAIIENNSMQDCGAAITADGCDFLAVSDNTVIGCTEIALQLDTCTYSHITTNTIRDPGGATTAAIALVGVTSSNIAENRISTAGGAIPPDYAVTVDAACVDVAIVQNDFRDGYSIAKIDDDGTGTTARRNLPEFAEDDAGPHLHTLAALSDVDTTGVQEGYVLTFDVALEKWVARPPSVLAVGELLVDSGGEFLVDDAGELLYEG